MLECLCVRLAVALDYHFVGGTWLGVDDCETNVGHCCLVAVGAELVASANDLVVVVDVLLCYEVVFSAVIAGAA